MRQSPSRTAELMSLMRAAEHQRPEGDRIVDDPYASLFLGPLMRGTLATLGATGRLGEAAEQIGWGVLSYTLARHRAIDELLLAALEEIDQIVLLGAGYDTRAFRLPLGSCPIFEVDHPSTHDRKAQIIDKHSARFVAPARRALAHDFTCDDLTATLTAAGFDPALRTFFIWEGVSMYLSRAAVKQTLSALSALSAPRSQLAADFWYLLDDPDLRSTAMRMTPNLLHLVGEPITFGIHPEDVGPFLGRLGWSLEGVLDSDTLQERYVTRDRSLLPGVYVLKAARR